VCNDTLANDWQEAQIQNSSGTMLAQVMKACTTSSGWTHAYFNLINYKRADNPRAVERTRQRRLQPHLHARR
jgi:hypothetical protein